MKRPEYTIIRCKTADKQQVMDLLCDADEYKLVRNHVDAVYYNGDTHREQVETRSLIKHHIAVLRSGGIEADSKREYINEWFFIPLR